MIVLSNPENNKLINHLQGEINMAIADGKSEEEIAAIANILYPLLEQGKSYDDIKSIITKVSNFLNRKVLTPITFSPGEFRFTTYGLSTNNRVPSIKMDLQGYYYEEAYSSRIFNYFDAYNGREIIGEDIKLFKPWKDDVNRIYIMAGGIITNVYFDKAYIPQSCIDKKSFYPTSPVNINCFAYCDTVTNTYISVTKLIDGHFKSLNNFYKLNITEDNDKYLSNFGVQFNLNKDVLFSKRYSFSF